MTIRPEFQLSMMRMSADVPAMIDFLTALGLRLQVTADRQVDGKTPWATLQGRRGRVALHHAHDDVSRGSSSVNFKVADADAAVSMLTDDRIPYRRHDEAFGRVVVAGTDVGDFWIGEDNPDDHGYTVHDAGGPATVDVVGVRVSSDLAAEQAVFATFGYHPETAVESQWQELAGSNGLIGLLAPADPDQVVVCSAAAEISFVTEEDLHDLVVRLVAAGYADAAVRDAGGVRALYVTDPDGREIQVYPGR